MMYHHHGLQMAFTGAVTGKVTVTVRVATPLQRQATQPEYSNEAAAA